MSVTAFALDYEADVSDAIPSNNWGQSVKIYTPYANTPEDTSGNFDPMLLTADSEVWVEYELSEIPKRFDQSPVELIWQTWEVNGKLPADVIRGWNQIQPYEYDETHAKFRYKDIVSGYGTDDFRSVFCICIGDRLGGHNSPTVTVTSLKFTNIQGSEDETEAEETTGETTAETLTETTTEAVTTGETTTVAQITTTAAQPAETTVTTVAETPKNGNIEASFMTAVVICIVAFLAVIVIVLLIVFKKNSGLK